MEKCNNNYEKCFDATSISLRAKHSPEQKFNKCPGKMIETSEELFRANTHPTNTRGAAITAHKGKHNHYNSTVEPQDRRK